MTSQDATMIDVSDDTNKSSNSVPEVKPFTVSEIDALTVSDLKANIWQIEKTVQTKDHRFLARVLRKIPITRRRLTHSILVKLVEHYFGDGSIVNEIGLRDLLLQFLSQIPKESLEAEDARITQSAITESTAAAKKAAEEQATARKAAAIQKEAEDTARSTKREKDAAKSSDAKAAKKAAEDAVEDVKRAEAAKKEEDAKAAEERRREEERTRGQEFVGPISIESSVYLQLLFVIFFIDRKAHTIAAECSKDLIEKINNQKVNRRTLHLLSAKAFFYYSRAHELTNQLAPIRPVLLRAHRTATLRHDDEGQATIINLLLQNYLTFNLYDQANKLVLKSSFPDSASSAQTARFLYYQGRINAIQLDYSDALKNLTQAQRKAPQKAARGFRLAVSKLLCIVRLLLGEIPERSFFRQAGLQVALKPYLQLTQAVRIGDLVSFHNVVDQFQNTFQTDKTNTLIQRLRHNVIKTGLKKISSAYSRISLSDICSKLQLDSVDDAEFIAAKAIRDGVIEATIDHEGKYLQSKETSDIYSTQEPQDVYHKRISFCLNIHNESLKAMRYPPDAHKANRESEEAKKERLREEQELASTIAEEDDEEDDFF